MKDTVSDTPALPRCLASICVTMPCLYPHKVPSSVPLGAPPLLFPSVSPSNDWNANNELVIWMHWMGGEGGRSGDSWKQVRGRLFCRW